MPHLSQNSQKCLQKELTEMHFLQLLTVFQEEHEFLAYDMTSIITHGNTCPIAEKGHNAENWREQQFNLSFGLKV